MADDPSLDAFYDAYERIEDEFQAELDISLNPRGPDMLFDLVRDFRLADGARAVDVGCGNGQHALTLAERFGFDVVGIDPVAHHLDMCAEALAAKPELAGRVRFEHGTAEAIPLDDASVDLVWCRDVLEIVADLPKAYGECRRVLRTGGRMLMFQFVGTDRLEPLEAAWLWPTMGVVPTSADVTHIEGAIGDAGLRVDECIDIGTEWGEWFEETTGKGARQLIHAARLLRAPDRYIEQFGKTAYDIMVGDAFWNVYGLIGKLSRRVYLLTNP
jgi:ubiquinone/menaquinone biosynthesis C-methylase UbiE